MKLILALFVSGLVLSSSTQNDYKVVDKNKQFIIVEIEGNLEQWFIDEENCSLQIGESVIVTKDMRLIKK